MHSLTTYMPHFRLNGLGDISYNSRSHLVFLKSKVNSARYIEQIFCHCTRMEHDEGGSYSFFRACYKLQQRVQDAWDNLSKDDIRHLHDHLHVRIHACVSAR